ncbi:MAG: hypothetical protein AAF560_25685 [Acidobacteriota bacterium]
MKKDQEPHEPSRDAIRRLRDDPAEGQLPRELSERPEQDLEAWEASDEELVAPEWLNEEVAKLPRSLELPRDLWPEIAPRLVERSGPESRFPWWSVRQAIAALLFMTLGGLLTYLTFLPQLNTTGRGVAEAPGVELSAELASIERRADFALAEADYLRAKEALWSAVYSSRDEVSPVTREVVERNLAVIDQAIRELRAALHADPGNHQLENLLLAQHRTEIDLLQRLAHRSSEI